MRSPSELPLVHTPRVVFHSEAVDVVSQRPNAERLGLRGRLDDIVIWISARTRPARKYLTRVVVASFYRACHHTPQVKRGMER